MDMVSKRDGHDSSAESLEKDAGTKAALRLLLSIILNESHATHYLQEKDILGRKDVNHRYIQSLTYN